MMLRELYTKPDQWLIEKTQDTYLWLLDRTGVYIATIEIGLYLGGSAYLIAKYGSLGWFTWFMLGLVGLVCMYQYYLQDKGLYEVYNATAMGWESGILRHALMGFQMGCILGDIYTRDLPAILFTLSLIAVIYLQCVKLRDRDKKPFFEKKEQLALEGSH